MQDNELLTLRRAAKQLVFRTGADGAPVSVGGTYFLVAYGDRLFAMTARHVVRDALPEQVLLATNDGSWIPARILEQFNPTDEVSGALDPVVYDLDVRHLTAKHRRNSWAYNLLAAEPNWLARCYESSFFFFGYPLERSTVDYGIRTTRSEAQQLFFAATYQGSSELSHCHTLRLIGRLGIDDLNGLSGSPVFAYHHVIGMKLRPLLAGIVLRGTTTSGLVHFLEAQAIKAVLSQISLQSPRKHPKRCRSLKTRMRRSPREHQ